MSTVTREEIFPKVAAVLHDQLACDETRISELTSFEELGADSLDHVEIIMRIEEEFGLDIDDDKAEQIKTVAQAIDHILSELAD